MTKTKLNANKRKLAVKVAEIMEEHGKYTDMSAQ